MSNEKIVAMILAGGRGTRLYELTKKVAKPAVFYGGKYRIIDFPLSNCANSGISTVGVLTQYENILLNSYVARDHYWGLNSLNGGVYVLPPRESDEKGFGLYQGTADAITQNLDFLDQEKADYVLILSGDHIYKMNYDKMLDYHKKNNSDCTIAVLEVSMDEAKRFGIMNTDENDNIIDFEEKPQNPKSNLASMGIYIFNYKTLRKFLVKDESLKDSTHDFGADIIPALLKENMKCIAYRFKGYWKDVGTIDSLWEANMDLLDSNNQLDLSDPTWKIYTQSNSVFPQIIGETAKISNSYINQGSVIDGHVKNSVIFNGVVIEKDTKVIDSVLLPGVVVESGAVCNRIIAAENVTLKSEEKYGSKNSKTITLVHKKGIREGQ